MSFQPTYARVVLPLPLSRPFSYRIGPEHIGKAREGMRAVVQFGAKRIYTGIIISLDQTMEQDLELKTIIDLPDKEPILNKNQLEFWKWMSSYYMCSRGSILKAALPAGLRPESETRISMDSPIDKDPGSIEEKRLLNVII